MTAIRSLMPRISGISDEIMRTASPRPANSCISPWISDFDPTSTPCVGSSRISTFGIGCEPSGQRDFLLIAARQRLDLRHHRRSLDLQFIDVPLRLLSLAGSIDQPGPGHTCEAGQAHVLCHGHIGHHAVLAPIFRKIANSHLNRADG